MLDSLQMNYIKLKEYFKKFPTIPFGVVALSVAIFVGSAVLTLSFSSIQSGGEVAQTLFSDPAVLVDASETVVSGTSIEAMVQSTLSSTPKETDEELIQKTFETYRNAAMNKDGASAVRVLSASTLQYYETLLRKTLYADEGALNADSVSTRFAVLLMRHVATREEILALENAHGFIVFALNNGLIGQTGLAQIKLDDVHVSGDEAFVSLMGEVSQDDKMHFVRENGTWKINLAHTIRSLDAYIVQMADSLGLSEEEFRDYALTFQNGELPSDKIWEPIL